MVGFIQMMMRSSEFHSVYMVPQKIQFPKNRRAESQSYAYELSRKWVFEESIDGYSHLPFIISQIFGVRDGGSFCGISKLCSSATL